MSTKYSIGYKIVSAVLSVVLAAVSLPLSAFAMQNAVSFLESPVEIEDKRDAFTKTYLNPDDTYTAVMYPEQIHENSSGEWKDIDNTLTYNGKTGKYENASNSSFSVSFSNKADSDTLVSMSGGTDGFLSWTVGLLSGSETVYPSGASFKSTEPEKDPDEDPDYPYPTKVTSYVSYENAFEGKGTDIRYTVSQNKVKEELVFHAPSDISSVVSVFSCENLTAVLNEDHTVSFLNSQGETEFTVHAPFVYDADHSVCPNVEVTLSSENEKVYITYTPDPEWLVSQERVYPIVFDPEITNRNYEAGIIDTFTQSGSTANNSSSAGIYVGHNGNTIYHGFLKFTQFPGVIDSSVEIRSVSLKLWFYSGTTTMEDIGIYPVSGSWNENTVTYLNEPSAGSLISTGTVTGNYSYVTYDLTEALAAPIYSHSTSHNGFLFKYTDETNTNDYNVFRSNNFGSASTRPLLTVTYTSLTDELRTGDTFRIKNQASGKYLTVHNGSNVNGTNLYQYSLDEDSDSQKFILRDGSANNTYTFLSVSSLSGTHRYVDVKVTDMPNYVPASGCNVQLWAGGYPDAQDWTLELADAANHLYLIRLAYNTNLVLTSYGTGNGTASGTTSTSTGNVFISTYSSGNNHQLWKIENTREYETYGIPGYLSPVYDEYLSEDDLPLSVGDFYGNLSLYSGRLTGSVYGEQNDDAFPIDTAFYIDSSLFDGTDYYESIGLYNGHENVTHYLYPYGFTKLSYYEFLIPQYENDEITAYRYVGNDGTSSFFVKQEEDNTIRYVSDHSGSELTYAYSSYSFEEYGITRTFNSKGFITKLEYEGKTYNYSYTISGGYKYLSSIWITENGSPVTVRSFTKNATSAVTSNGTDTETFTANFGSFQYGALEITPYADTVNIKDSHADEKLVLTINTSTGSIRRVKTRPYSASSSDVRLTDMDISYGKNTALLVYPGEDLSFSTGDDLVTEYLFDSLSGKTTVVTYTDGTKTETDSLTVYGEDSYACSEGNRKNYYGKTELTGTTNTNVSLSTSVKRYNSSSYLFNGDVYSTSSVRKSLLLSAGSYTVSAYVKLEDLTSSNGGLKLVTDLGGTVFESERMTGTTPADVDGGWQRVFYTFTVSSDGLNYVEFRTDSIASGKAYVSAVQVERSSYPSPYNYASGWSGKTLEGSYTSLKNRLVASLSGFGESGRTWLLQFQAESGIVSPKLPAYTESGNTVDGSYARIYVTVSCYDANHNLVTRVYTAEADPFTEISYPFCVIDVPDDLTVVSLSVYLKVNRIAGTIHLSDFSLREIGYYGGEETEPDEGTTTETETTLPNGNTQKVTTTVWNNGTFDNEILVVTEITDTNDVLLYSESVDTVYSASNVIESIYTSITDFTTANTVISESYTEKRDSAGLFVSKSGTTNTSVYSTSVIDDYSSDTLVSETTERLSLDSSNNIIARITTSTAYSTDSITGNKTVTSTDERENQTVTVYDQDGNVLSVTYPEGTAPVYYTYNSDGQIASMSQAGITDSFTYIRDNISMIIRGGNGSGSYTYTYDSNGNLSGVKVGDRTLVSYLYDSGNRLTKISYANGYYEEYTYDRYNMPASRETSDGRIYTYRFDSRGRLYEEYDADANERIRYEYDPEGSLIRKTVLQNGEISYILEYTEEGTRFRDKGGTVFLSTLEEPEKTYDGLDRITHEEYGTDGSIEKDYTYLGNLDGTTTDLISSEEFSGGGVFSYTYDSLGRILTVSENNTLMISYTYDSLGELIREDNACSNKSYTWEYDGNGNILYKKEYAYTTGTLGTATRTIAYGYSDTDFTDLLTSYDGVTITSDLSGNPLNWRNASSMVWTGRQLTSLALTGGTAVSYTYNGDGIRTSKMVGTKKTEYLLDGTKVLKQVTTEAGIVTEQILFYYDTTEELTGFRYNGNDYFYGKDCTGIIRYIYNETGDVVVTYTYDAWGNPVSTTGTAATTIGTINPFRYKSYYFDTETGFYYLQSRYYDSEIGRFINSDSIEYIGSTLIATSFNIFIYCNNDPVQNEDSTGHIASTVIRFFAGMLLGFFFQLLVDFIDSMIRIILGSIDSLQLSGIENYVESMLTWGINTLNIFNYKLIAFLVPIGVLVAKYVVKLITKEPIKFASVLADVALAIINGLINVWFTSSLKANIKRIQKSNILHPKSIQKLAKSISNITLSLNSSFLKVSFSFSLSSSFIQEIINLVF